MMWKIAAAAGLAGLALAEAGGCTYFYRRTMMRYNAKRERTMKMSGVNWKQYYEQIAPKREWTVCGFMPHILKGQKGKRQSFAFTDTQVTDYRIMEVCPITI